MFLVAAVVCGTAGSVINAAAGDPSKLSKHAVLELGGLVLVLWAIAAVLLLLAIRRFNMARRATEQKRRQESARRLAADDVTRARRLAAQLLAGEVPAVDRVWNVVLQPGERVLLEGSAGYSRYYGFGAPGAYAQVSTRNAGAVAGAALRDRAVVRAGGRRRVQGAAFAAAARWRDRQESRVVVTDRRLLCQVQAKGWVSFDHVATAAIQAVTEKGGVVLEYPGTAPVCLSGPVTAQIMVIVVWALYGADGLREHPVLTPVRSAAPFAPGPGVTNGASSKPSDTEAPWVSAPVGNDVAAGDGPAADTPRQDLLGFVATHELVLAEHAARLLGMSEPNAAEQLEDLVEQGLVLRVRLSVRSPTAYRITQEGAVQVDTALAPQSPLDLAGYRHAVGVQEL